MIDKNYVEEGLRNLFNEVFELTPTEDNCSIVFAKDSEYAVIILNVLKDRNKVLEFLNALSYYDHKSIYNSGPNLFVVIETYLPMVSWSKYTI